MLGTNEMRIILCVLFVFHAIHMCVCVGVRVRVYVLINTINKTEGEKNYKDCYL